MAGTNAKKLEALKADAADRQQRRRQRLLERKRPDTAVVDRVLVETLAYVLAATPTTADSVHKAGLTVSTLVSTAKRILVEREGYDPAETAKAIKLRLDARPQHFDPTYIPSLNPDHAGQAERLTIAREAREAAATS